MWNNDFQQEMVKAFQTQQNKLALRTSPERPLKYTMSNTSLYGTDVVVEEQRQLVDSIARHVVYGESRQSLSFVLSILASHEINMLY